MVEGENQPRTLNVLAMSDTKTCLVMLEDDGNSEIVR